MKEKVTVHASLVGVAVILGILFGALWTRAQSVSPIRFDEQAPVVPAAIDGGSLVLDAYVTAVTSPTQGVETVVVPRARIRDRCDDGDGCIVRIFISSTGGSSMAGDVEVKFFSTTSVATVWRLHSLEGDLEASGATTDGSSQHIVFVSTTDRFCYFRDDGSTNAYILEAQNLTPQSVSDCVLRIDD